MLRGLRTESSRSRLGGTTLPWSESAPKASYLQVLWYIFFINLLYLMTLMHSVRTSWKMWTAMFRTCILCGKMKEKIDSCRMFGFIIRMHGIKTDCVFLSLMS